jgi:hypothetical protein
MAGGCMFLVDIQVRQASKNVGDVKLMAHPNFPPFRHTVLDVRRGITVLL